MQSAATACLTVVVAGIIGCSGIQPFAPPSPSAGERDALGARSHQAVATDKPTAPLFNDLGDHHHPVTTDSPTAQRYFDQGLILAYGFNHAEAIRSFREALRLDPECAMCAWGIALAYGPNINAPMGEEAVAPAYDALTTAQKLAPHATQAEQAYIHALAKRYVAAPVADRSTLDRAYADAMRDVAADNPDDLDAATLFAEALMDTMPWDYWVDPETPKPATTEVMRTLESVLERDPDHPGANHFYIHIVEASSSPHRAEAAADRLGHLVPGAGHLVHMPSHIYYRVGRYEDAVKANEMAAAADESYITQCNAQGFYPAAYYPHNVHFLWAAASEEGRSAVALAAAKKLVERVPEASFKDYPFLEEFRPVYWYALLRFARWQDMLAEPAPGSGLVYSNGMWHYARGIALVGVGRGEDANAELEALRDAAASDAVAELKLFSGSSATELMKIATHVLSAEIASVGDDHDAAIEELRAAVAIQDRLPYTEPPPWYFPVRQGLGAELLRAGRASQAEAVYREDLEQYPRNGRSLFGLARSLEAQGKSDAARVVERRFHDAWASADVKLRSSRF